MILVSYEIFSFVWVKIGEKDEEEVGVVAVVDQQKEDLYDGLGFRLYSSPVSVENDWLRATNALLLIVVSSDETVDINQWQILFSSDDIDADVLRHSVAKVMPYPGIVVDWNDYWWIVSSDYNEY